MDVQIIQHDMPLDRFRITGDQALKMGESIPLAPSFHQQSPAPSTG
jgi:hypothetical protein